jgi:hypothetical protein
MDDYGNLSFEKTYALGKFFLKNLINKANFNKMITGAQGAELSLTTVPGPLGNSFWVRPIETAGLFNVQQIIL